MIVPRTPELQAANAGLVAWATGENLVRGAKHAVEDARKGVVAPSLSQRVTRTIVERPAPRLEAVAALKHAKLKRQYPLNPRPTTTTDDNHDDDRQRVRWVTENR